MAGVKKTSDNILYQNNYLQNTIEKNGEIWYNIFINYSGGVILRDKSFIEAMELIVSALKERGYDPFSQIYGYLKENEPAYITSHKGARGIIQTLNKDMVQDYLNKMCK